MSDPITRTLVELHPFDSMSQVVERLIDPDQSQAVIVRREQSVPWCDEHDSQISVNPGVDPAPYIEKQQIRCLRASYRPDTYRERCRLRDPHADNAVWRDTP